MCFPKRNVLDNGKDFGINYRGQIGNASLRIWLGKHSIVSFGQMKGSSKLYFDASHTFFISRGDYEKVNNVIKKYF